MTIEDLSNYYSKLSILDRLRFRKLCYHKKKVIKLEVKLEGINELLEEVELS